MPYIEQDLHIEQDLQHVIAESLVSNC